MSNQQQVIDSLPPHLRPFAALQDYSAYTARDQALRRAIAANETPSETALLARLQVAAISVRCCKSSVARCA